MSDVVDEEVTAWSVGGAIETAGDIDALTWLPERDKLPETTAATADFAVQVLRDAAEKGMLDGRHDVRLYGHAGSGLSISAWPALRPEEEIPGPEHTEPVIEEAVEN
jgi:hypothetical protein